MRLAGALLLVPLLCGCVRLIGDLPAEGRDSGRPDLGGALDGAPPDAPGEGGASDAAAVQDAPAKQDLPPAKDLLAADTPAPPDAPVPDKSPPLDKSPPDKSPPPDVAGYKPCGAGATGSVVQGAMSGLLYAFCQGSFSMTQGNATSLCNASTGWTMCTASDYQAVFATSAPPVSVAAWIAGCIRSGGPLYSPKDGVCLGGSTVTAPVAAGWSCNTQGPVQQTEVSIGLVTSSSCWRVGTNSASNAAFWLPRNAHTSTAKAAMCCR